MTRESKRTGHPGVSLIEILVVLAIIGVLIALTAAALQKTVETQNARTSETQVFKLQQALDAEYNRVVAKCAKDSADKQIPPQIVVACDGNEARAKAVWTAFQLRLNFPDSFAEATFTPLTILDSSGAQVYTVPRPPAFDAFVGLQPALGQDSTFEPEEESGALLYVILAKRSQQGGGAMATGAEDVTQASRRKVTFVNAGNQKEFETFSDAFKRSVGFRRWEQTMTTLNPTRTAINNESRYDLRSRTNPLLPLDASAPPAKALNEAQRAPYVDATKDISSDDTATPPPAPRRFHNRDPLDPQELVWKWSLLASDQRTIIRDGVYPLTNQSGQPTGRFVRTGLYFNGHNRMPNVYSLGKTKFITGSTTSLSPDDDILGLRLRKPGEKGYKQ